MKFIQSIAVTVLLISTSTVASAQSTIAPRPLDLTFGKSFWGTLLPSYDLGDGDNDVFQDDLDNLGAYWELAAVRRVLNTRTSFEARGYFGYSWSNQGRSGDADIWNPIGGATTSLSGGRGTLDTDTSHYGLDLAIIDTWQTRMGGLSAGLAFSYFAFDQDFDARYNNIGLFEQSLDQDFLGGKGILQWEGFLADRPTSLRASFGYFDLEADYEYEGRTLAGNASESLADHSGLVELKLTRWYQIGDYYTGLSLGGMYLTDFANIRSIDGDDATIGTTDATTLNAMIEILL